MSIEKEMATAIRELLERELAPIREKLEKIEPISKEDFEKSCLSKKEQDGQFLANWKADIDRKFVMLGKVVESLGNTLMKMNGSVYWCEADIKAFKELGIEPKPFTLEHMKKGMNST